MKVLFQFHHEYIKDYYNTVLISSKAPLSPPRPHPPPPTMVVVAFFTSLEDHRPGMLA